MYSASCNNAKTAKWFIEMSYDFKEEDNFMFRTDLVSEQSFLFTHTPTPHTHTLTHTHTHTHTHTPSLSLIPFKEGLGDLSISRCRGNSRSPNSPHFTLLHLTTQPRFLE